MKFDRSICAALLLAVPSVGLMLAAGCNPPPPAMPPALPPTPIAAGTPFLGNEACAPCHAKEFRVHKDSFHARTAHRVEDLGKIELPKKPLFGTRCVLLPDGPRFSVSVDGSILNAVTLRYGLGSGKTGITFVAMPDSSALFEMRASYFPKIKQWYVTPGQKKLESNETGFDYPEERSRTCMGCHTTTLPEHSIVPEPRFLGVGCESCHGPGRDHVAAMQRGERRDLKMERLGSLGGEKLNTLCGKCHRTIGDVMARSPRLASETQRFQTYGIMKSRCFVESKDKLSCLTCHDPHTNATTDMKFYEKRCLTCHGGSHAAASPVPRVAGKSCPVNPKSGCIACHMPARKIISDADRSPFAVDHLIHIQPKGSAPAPYHAL